MKNIIYKNEKLSKYSWFNLGGPTEVLFKPNSIDELKFFLLENEINKKNIFILGAGSNTLFRDTGFNGFVIKLGKEFTNIKIIGDNKIEVGAATLDKKLADFACQNSISGFEFLSCIPGSIGGAVTMNSGCYGKDVSKIFHSLRAIDLNGNIKVFKRKEIKFLYRGNNLDKKLIILNVIFQGEEGNKNQIQNLQDSFLKEKKESQPSRIKTCGSTFKNPKNKKAWELIKKSNCSNLTVGGASISDKHCNFFVNNGKATSSDVEKLIEKVKEKVFLKTGTNLELEIKIIGEK
tara:strand:+ start:3471 stop:4343 length:873 start_codon:yes stop_codon:yes gene_type:complete